MSTPGVESRGIRISSSWDISVSLDKQRDDIIARMEEELRWFPERTQICLTAARARAARTRMRPDLRLPNTAFLQMSAMKVHQNM